MKKALFALMLGLSVLLMTGCGNILKDGLVKVDRSTFASPTSRGKVVGKAIYSAWLITQQTDPEKAKEAEKLYLQLTASPNGTYDIGVLNTMAVSLLREAIGKKKDPATAALATSAILLLGHVADDYAAKKLETSTAGEFVEGVILGIEEAKSSQQLAAIAELVAQYQELKKEQEALKAAEKIEKQKEKEAAAEAAAEAQPEVPAVTEEEYVYKPFSCPGGNCTFKDLSKDASIAFQNGLAMQLADYVVHESRTEPFTPTIEENLMEFLLRMSKLDEWGYAETWLVIDSFVIKNGKLVELNFLLRQEEGNYIKETCVSCAPPEYEEFYAEKGLVKMKAKK